MATANLDSKGNPLFPARRYKDPRELFESKPQNPFSSYGSLSDISEGKKKAPGFGLTRDTSKGTNKASSFGLTSKKIVEISDVDNEDTSEEDVVCSGSYHSSSAARARPTLRKVVTTKDDEEDPRIHPDSEVYEPNPLENAEVVVTEFLRNPSEESK